MLTSHCQELEEMVYKTKCSVIKFPAFSWELIINFKVLV